MKKHLLALLFMGALLCTAGYAQNGYKGYGWGMTLSQITAKCPDLKAYDYIRWPVPSYALMYFYSNEIESGVPNPLAYETKSITAYESEKEKLKFYFVGQYLSAVEIEFNQNRILKELETQYGDVSPVRGSYGSYQYETASWRKNEEVVVVWENSGYGIEHVTYVSGKWLKIIIDKAMDVYRADRSSSKSRLD
jgi:hypothetical protein